MLVIFEGDKLLAERKKQKLSQAELATRAGTTIRYIRILEKGEKRNPSANLAYRLAIALDVPMETFMLHQPEENDDFYFARSKNCVPV